MKVNPQIVNALIKLGLTLYYVYSSQRRRR